MKTALNRPRYISFLCFCGFVWSMLSFLVVFSPAVKKVSIWYPASLGLLVAARFISMIGVWHMKKWGVLLFFTSVFLGIFQSIFLNDVGIIQPVSVLFFGIPFIVFFSKMDDNL
jgi:hypothetical protein